MRCSSFTRPKRTCAQPSKPSARSWCKTRAAEKAYGQPVYLLADCVSPTEENLSLLRDYDSCVLNGDFGTELAGECIGYLAVSERAREAELLFAAIAGAGRACGYVNPPSLMQRAVEKCLS